MWAKSTVYVKGVRCKAKALGDLKYKAFLVKLDIACDFFRNIKNLKCSVRSYI